MLITGSNGQLGSEISDLVSDYQNMEFIFKDLPELDICDSNALNTFLNDEKITAIINCAAYTAVDKAEDNPESAERVNSNGVLNLVKALEKVDGKLIHISTDYVFDGNSSIPYEESDPVNPVGVYGKTKRAGELNLIDSDIDAIIVRTSWLYSSYGTNFVKTMLRLGNERDSVNVIFDQIGTPTYARDLAKACLEILSSSIFSPISKRGKIYHYSNEGVISWYDFAINIMEVAKLGCEVIPIQTTDYPTLAKRPHYSVFNKSKIKKDFEIKIPYWKRSLEECLFKIKL